MWLSNSSVGRKFVMAVTGAVFVLFVTFHCLMNTVAICWPVAYNCICEFLGANWYALLASAGLALFIIIHIIYAMMLTLQNRKARGNDRYLVVKKPATVEWSSQNMFVLGIVILAFLVVHLIQFWAKMQLVEILGKHGAIPPSAGTLFLQEAFSTNWTWIVYVVGFCALWFHMNHGFWSMFQSVGWDNQVWICRLKKISCWWTSIVIVLFLAQAIVFTVKAHEEYYKTDSELRAQYVEMLAPMFEKSFGKAAADQITSVPFEQMEQMVTGTLAQFEAPEAQSYFANDPEFPARLETLRAASGLIEYLKVDKPVENELPANPQPTNNNN